MKIVIDIPDDKIPTKQEIIDTYIYFIDGKVCEFGGYGFMVLPKGYGDLIDRSVLINELNEQQVEFDEFYKGLGRAKTITNNAPTVIEADTRCKE